MGTSRFETGRVAGWVCTLLVGDQCTILGTKICLRPPTTSGDHRAHRSHTIAKDLYDRSQVFEHVQKPLCDPRPSYNCLRSATISNDHPR